MGKKDRWQHNFDRDFFLKRFFVVKWKWKYRTAQKGDLFKYHWCHPPPPKDLAANLSRKQLHPNHCISQALDMFECLQGRISMLQFRAAVLFWWTIFCKRRQIQVLEQSELNLHISCVQACLHCTFFGFFRDKRSWWTLHPVKH